MGEPVTEFFGKDVAEVIFFHLFQLNMRDVNAQYNKFRVINYDKPGVAFRMNNHLYEEEEGYFIKYNYRYWRFGIRSNWPTEDGWCMSTRTFKLKLPKNYLLNYDFDENGRQYMWGQE